MTELTYDRFTDWRLSARVRFLTPEAAAAYLAAARDVATLNEEYCGSPTKPSTDTATSFFLQASFACGSLQRTKLPGELQLWSATR